MALRIRRGTDAERQTITFAEGELVYTTDTKELYIGDGTTPGGILVSQTEETPIGGIANLVEDITPQLGGDLDLNNFEINGIGDIDITGTITADVVSGSLFVGDGSGLTNLPQNEGIVEGSNYRINIVGDDSSVIVDTATNIITASELITNQLEVDIINVPNNILEIAGGLSGFPQELRLISTDQRSIIKFTRESELDISQDTELYGSILFERNDLSGPLTTGFISGYNSGILLGSSPTGTFGESTYLSFVDNNLGVGTFSPQSTLDVRGNAVVAGNLTIANGSLILDSSQAISTIPTPVAGQFIYDNDTGLIGFYDGSDWYSMPKTNYDLGITVFSSGIIIGQTNTAERDQLGQDSTLATGAVIYNTTDDRLQFFQAGSWVSLINNGSTAGQMLAWDGAQWSAVDPEITAGTIENANTLNGFSGSYYLDYNNFTNTPIMPTVLTDLGIVDGTVGQVLTTNGTGVFSFQTVSSATALTDLTDVSTAGLTIDEIYLSAVTTLSVTNLQTTAYLFDQYGGNNPTIYTINGTTVAFDLNVVGHPFLIQDSTGTNFNIGLIHVAENGTVSVGAAAQGQTAGTLYWKIPSNISGNYQYRCSIHGTMLGVITITEAALASTALQPADVGAFTFTGSILDTGDSSVISIAPATIFNSDVNIENDLVVRNKIKATTIEVENIITTANGTPELQSDTDIILNAGTRVEVLNSPFKFASFSTAERNSILAENGDVIYNTTDNKFQGYANGIWVDLH